MFVTYAIREKESKGPFEIGPTPVRMDELTSGQCARVFKHKMEKSWPNIECKILGVHRENKLTFQPERV